VDKKIRELERLAHCDPEAQARLERHRQRTRTPLRFIFTDPSWPTTDYSYLEHRIHTATCSGSNGACPFCEAMRLYAYTASNTITTTPLPIEEAPDYTPRRWHPTKTRSWQCTNKKRLRYLRKRSKRRNRCV